MALRRHEERIHKEDNYKATSKKMAKLKRTTHVNII